MGSPLVGFGLKPKNNFNDLLHDPDVGGPAIVEYFRAKYCHGRNPKLDSSIGPHYWLPNGL